jgi:NADH-quinone oxidoreductase subunit E
VLTQEEQREIEEELARYPQRQAVCVEALRIVQRHRGWVSDEAVQEIAGFLEMTPDEVDSVATFYNLVYRKPVGRHVILACDSVTCWVMGTEGIQAYLGERLGIRPGDTTEDGRFTLLPVVCLGACDRAPAMMIDTELYGDLTPERIDEILATYDE